MSSSGYDQKGLERWFQNCYGERWHLKTFDEGEIAGIFTFWKVFPYLHTIDFLLRLKILSTTGKEFNGSNSVNLKSLGIKAPKEKKMCQF